MVWGIRDEYFEKVYGIKPKLPAEQLEEFITAIDSLVHEWKGADAFNPRAIPRKRLEHIWQQAREHSVHELAVKQEELDLRENVKRR